MTLKLENYQKVKSGWQVGRVLNGWQEVKVSFLCETLSRWGGIRIIALKFAQLHWLSAETCKYSAFRIFSQILFDFKKSISGPNELKFSGKTLYAIL